MLSYLLLMVLLTEAVLMVRYDKKVFGNYFSPVAVLAFPLIVVLLLAAIFCPVLGFRPLGVSVILLSIVGLFVFWTGSIFWSLVIPEKVLGNIILRFEKKQLNVSFALKTAMQFLSWIVIVTMLFFFWVTLQKYGSIARSGSDEFTRDYGGSGIQGHILGLAIPLLIFFIGIYKKRDYLTLLTIIFLLIISLLYRVKTWMFVPILGGLLLRFIGEKKLRIKPLHTILFLISAVLLFLLSYAYSVNADNLDFYEKLLLLLKHFMGYLFAGVLGFSEHINQGLPIGAMPDMLIKPFLNIYNFLTGGEISGVVSPYHVYIDNISFLDSNVKTFFGTILIFGGYINAVVYLIIISIILYFFWIVAAMSRNYWIVVLYAFFAAPLAIGWFDFYYNQLSFVELPVYIVILWFLTRKHSSVTS